MSDYLKITVTFLDPCFHGRGDGDEPEWPPSPLRLLQAIIAANAAAVGTGSDLDNALTWLESLEAPLIVAPHGDTTVPYCLSVPNNAMDIVGKAWARGNYFGGGDANPSKHKALKTVWPTRIIDEGTVHYLWKLNGAPQQKAILTESLSKAVGRIVALGWGIDFIVGHAELTSSEQLHALFGERWRPATSTGANALRVPIPGTLNALRVRHAAFLQRISSSGFVPVEPLTHFKVTGYRRNTDLIMRPYAVFELRHDDGTFCRYPQRKLMHIAGMTRHLAKNAMKRSPPADVNDSWVEHYVVGHRDENNRNHRQFSYLPLPSIGHEHVDHAVRRVAVVAPIGDEVWLEHLAQRLAGRQLEPENGHEFGKQGAPTLIRVYRDRVARSYTAAANKWASVTPVILPGHDDHKAAKTCKLIDAALAQSGIDQPCIYEWSTLSQFQNSLSAYKYDRNNRLVYFKPRYLQELAAVHLTLTFDGDLEVPGPLVIGAGRHCGFGLMARLDTSR